MAKFIIKQTLFIKAKQLLYIIGEVTDGHIKIGMKFTVRDKEFFITNLDFVDGKENDIPYSYLALGITPNDKSFFDSLLSETSLVEIQVK